MRRAVAVVAFLFAALTAPLPARAGTLSAILRSPEGAALPGVVVIAEGPQGRHSTVTGPDGGCTLELAPGAYTLAVDIPGFVVSQPSVALGDDATRLSLVLAPAPVREHVIVAATRGDAPLTTLGVSGTVLDAARVAEREPSMFLELLREVPGLSVGRTSGARAES
jgi:hypothetical protein